MSLGRNSVYRSFAEFCALAVGLMVCIAVPVARAQTYTDLLNFDGKHGANPDTPQLLAQGRDGNLYGTTEVGNEEFGVVFRIMPEGTSKVIHYFDGLDGSRSYSGLILGTDGSFYGTTAYGGSRHRGTVFKITPSGNVTTLHTFSGGSDGQPFAPPIQVADGDFYGVTDQIAYKISRSGTFTALPSIGGSPTVSPLLQAADGTILGTTGTGGAFNYGMVYKLTNSGYETIFSFDAHVPAYNAPLIQGSDGNFYGTTYTGGNYRQGVVFKLTPKGAVTTLHNFPDPNYPQDGAEPQAGLVLASDGNFYGVTTEGGTGTFGPGVFFKITAAGDYSILYNFEAATGSAPASTPFQHTNGKIYGLTVYGGTNNMGVAYSIDLGLPPFVRFLPAFGTAGEIIEFLGQGFTGTTAVSFNGTAASFAVASDTYLTAVVPTGATSGTVTVTTPGSVLNSNQAFQVVP
jgi:uncharacterized repeat protein (TIGR03803 family)